MESLLDSLLKFSLFESADFDGGLLYLELGRLWRNLNFCFD
jgi:hypothetical protein